MNQEQILKKAGPDYRSHKLGHLGYENYRFIFYVSANRASSGQEEYTKIFSPYPDEVIEWATKRSKSWPNKEYKIKMYTWDEYGERISARHLWTVKNGEFK